MALKIDTYSTSDGSVQAPKQVPDSIEKLLDNAADIPSNTRIPVRIFEDIPDGTAASVATWTAPYDCEIVAAGGYKKATNGGAGDMVELETGTPATIVTWDGNNGDTYNLNSGIDDTLVRVSAGTVLNYKATSAMNCAALVWFDIVPQ